MHADRHTERIGGETINQPIGGMRRSRLSNRLRQTLPGPVSDGAKSAARVVGTATASRRPLPDFLIIGTKKGGTTSVANWLKNLPKTKTLPSIAAPRLIISIY